MQPTPTQPTERTQEDPLVRLAECLADGRTLDLAG